MSAQLETTTQCDALINLRHDLDISTEQLHSVLGLTKQVKTQRQKFALSLKGRYLALLFEKPSLRTRMTFELAVKQLGGDYVTQIGMVGGREPLKDVARNLARWTDAIVARTFEQHTIDELAYWSRLPVVNALSDLYHPCQALADVFTIQEWFGSQRPLRLAYVGDGNNVVHSLLLTASRLGISCVVATPAGYEPRADIVATAQELAAETRCEVEITNDPAKAVARAHAVYTDVWASMGQEEEADNRKEIFSPFQVNDKLMAKALPDAIFMHCLPAKRDQEVTDAVIESSRSAAFDQAENRLHVQKALLLSMLG